MKKKLILGESDRDFFRVLSDYAFSNPFEKASLQFGYTIAGGRYPSGEVLSTQVFQKVVARLSEVTGDWRAGWQDFEGEDRSLIRLATLHHAYYRCFAKFDELIQSQVSSNVTSSGVSFAKEILSLLRKAGFTKAESLRYFSFFYQLRRAWYFINHGLIGVSSSIQKLRSHLWRSVFTAFPEIYERVLWNRMEDFSTFLIGETGTGKGTAASAIGRSGFIPFEEKKNRFTECFTENFIEINLSQYSEALIESELFGHRKGAFTGAVDKHKGVFSLCSPHGSIFLDEIGDVSTPIQIKLLKVLEDRSFSTVGGHEKLQFSGRIITATNRTLSELQQQNSFREDFYYRLCSNVIRVPTLRQQIYEDPHTLEVLLGHTINRIVGEPDPELLDMVLLILKKNVGEDYVWPGNVRELEQAVRSILLTENYQKTSTMQFDDNAFRQELERGTLSVRELISGYCNILYKQYGTFEKVARITGLDPRTVKKYINSST